MATEKLKFRIELFAIAWDKNPTCEIYINKKSHWAGEITGTEKAPTVIEFIHECIEGDNYDLTIDRKGKDKRQTVVENGKIVKDQMLQIKSIEIDEIDIGSLVYEGVYTPSYPGSWAHQQKQAGNELPTTLKNVTQMGHNGTWTLSFTSPFYMWLLENLY